MAHDTNTDSLMSVHELADYPQVPPKTIYSWRSRGDGPRGIRVGKYVRYRRGDVEDWLASLADPAAHGASVTAVTARRR